MRERNLLSLFFALNVALAGAFIAYLFLSNHGQPAVLSTTFPSPTKTNRPTNALVAVAPKELKTNVPATGLVTDIKSEPATLTNLAETKPVFTRKKFTWEQVESEGYLKYIESLRAVGCPEDKVRHIILADINDLCANQRLQEAVAHDTQWWRPEPVGLRMVNVLQEKGRELEAQRRSLVTKLLGSDALDDEKGGSLLWSAVPLTGPVLGKLSAELHNQVQEICARSMERHQSTLVARANGGQPPNPVEVAKLRDQTRLELKHALNSQELEEFLLRYSHNAEELRNELRDLEPTPEEFRKVFHALDPVEHQMQLDYGNTEALSGKQKERYEHQRDEMIKEALGPQRFETLSLTKEPLYRQAQMFATQYNAPAKAVLHIYQMTKANETKRQKVMNDPGLTPQEKSDAINAIYQEQQQSIQQIASEEKGAH